MKQEIRDEWTRRLRSGDYEQGHGVLVRKNRKGNKEYCCLGVLCVMAVEAGIVTSRFEDDHYFYGDQNEESSTHLPEVVQKWAGISEEIRDRFVYVHVPEGTVCPNNKPEEVDSCGYGDCVVCRELSLIDFNDSQHAPFSKIADVIEKWL